MKTIAAALFVALSLAPRDGELEFVATRGAELDKRFTETTRWTLDALEREVDGSPLSVPLPNMSGAATRELVVVDTYAAVEQGVATRLAREFTAVSGTSALRLETDAGSEDFDFELASGLAGTSVVFERRDAGIEPVAKFAEGVKADAALLEGLREDLELRALLPKQNVGPEDRWELDAAAWVDVLRPGGALKLSPALHSVPDSTLLTPADLLATTLCTLADNACALSGTAYLHWRESTTDGAHAYAVIEVELDLAARTELGDELRRRLLAAGEDSARDELTLEMACTSDGKGELVWDLTADRCHSFQLALESRIDARFAWTEESSSVGYHFELRLNSELSATSAQR